MTIAQQLAWRRFWRDLAVVVIPILIGVLSDPAKLAQLGLPARVITIIGILVVPIVTGLIKLRKENLKGLDIPGDPL